MEPTKGSNIFPTPSAEEDFLLVTMRPSKFVYMKKGDFWGAVVAEAIRQPHTYSAQGLVEPNGHLVRERPIRMYAEEFVSRLLCPM
jgi:hypothetical protein